MKNAYPFDRFRPPFYLRNPMLQTFLGSNRPVRSRTGSMLSAAKPIVLTGSDGARLAGAYSAAPAAKDMGLVVILHGWEGSIFSVYVTATAQYLFDCGYQIFRLNFRDHGNTQHLNQGLFYATLLDEVFSAVIQTAISVGDIPIYLCGFSLGGNFALRIGRKWSLSPPPGIDLRHIAAISPVIDPAKATDEIDKHPLIRCYFMRKWRRSLLKKQQLFPKYYDLDDVCALKTVRQMTEKLLARYSPYSTADEYFAGYTIHSHDLESLAVPTTIITASDDPILPVSDYHALSLGQRMRMIIHDYGGHNGFIRNFAGKTWYESYLSKVFADRSPKKTHDV